jgi:uncharacterized protein
MQWIKNFFSKIILHEKSADKLALSFCVGNYIAFSPFIGLHTIMAFLFSWLFNLNLAVTCATTYFINNPWTAIPVYMIDYMFGHWLVHDILHLNFTAITPTWIHSLTSLLEQKLGINSPCFWSFLIGGNILGIIISIVLYPNMQKLFKKLLQQKNENISTK